VGTVTPAELVELYVVNNTVRITTGTSGTGNASTVAGVVPPGKTLEIAGSVAVADNITLDVQGFLHILENGELSLADPTDSVLLVDRSGSVRVDGFVYEEPDFFPVTGGLNPRVSFGPDGGIVVDDTAGAAIERVNWYFTLVNRVKWNAGAPLSAANLVALDKWVPGKTLLLNGDADIETGTAATNTDISAKGALVVTGNLAPDGDVTPVTATIVAGQTLTTNGIPVLVTESGILNLANNGASKSALAGSFKINGTLTATDPATGPASNFETSTIPPTVDLTNATLVGNAAAGAWVAVFKFPNNADADATVVSIKKIDMTYDLNISNTKGLIIDLIDNVDTAGKILTLPNNVPTTVNRINIAGGTLSIKGEDGDAASKATVKPGAIYGGQLSGPGRFVVLSGVNILLDGPVNLASDTTITATNLGPFGREYPVQLAQLAKINGGVVNIGNTAVTIDSPLTLNTNLTTGTAAVTFAADTTLTRQITANNYIIAAGKTLTIEPYGGITVGTALAIGPGVYTAKDGAFAISNTGVISTSVDNATLTIGDTTDPAKLSLKSQANVSTTGTFTPTASATPVAPVTLNGILGAIIVPTGTTPGTFTVGGTADLNLGTGGQIALANNATLGIAINGKISGFGATAPATKDDETVRGKLLGVPYNGKLTVTITAPTVFADGVITNPTAAVSDIFKGDVTVGPPVGSGAIFKASSF
jgi:hypothetical protein